MGGIGTRISSWYNSITLCTRVVILFCSFLYLYGLLFGVRTSLVCELPQTLLISWMNVYRFITSPFFHGGILHILLNMMAYQPLGVYLENSVGTLQYFILIIYFCIGTNAIHFTMAYGLSMVDMRQYMYQCSIGFSGVLFALLVIECVQRDLGSRSIFGMFSVSSKLYPWILLIILQLIMPNISFLGHLAGIVTGYLYIYGMVFSSKSFLHKVENSSAMSWIVLCRGYVLSPDNGNLPIRNNDSSSSNWNWVSQWWPRRETTAFTGQGYILGSASNTPSPPSPIPHNGSNPENFAPKPPC